MNLNLEGIEKLESFDDNVPIFMLNYLNYKDIVEETGKTGAETYDEYLIEAAAFFEQLDANVVFKGRPQGIILGPSEEELWDEILIVKYVNKYEFFKIFQMEGYPLELRASALSDSRLIFCE